MRLACRGRLTIYNGPRYTTIDVKVPSVRWDLRHTGVTGLEENYLQLDHLGAQDAPAHQVLAQQHTEHGRLGGIVPQLLRQVQPGLGGSGAQQQPPPAPQQQHHLVPGGLLDFFNAGVFYLGGGLPDHGTQANGVQRHITPPPSSGRTAR